MSQEEFSAMIQSLRKGRLNWTNPQHAGGNQVSYPNLTFFCELGSQELDDLIDDRMLADLKSLDARISLGLPDLSPQRAAVVRRLNDAGIPLDAWLLLPREAGYWLNLRNAPQAFQKYFEFLDWTRENNLLWDAVGLDIEPDLREMKNLFHWNWNLLPRYLRRLFARVEWKRGLAAYNQLVAQIHQDGYRVETYQFPLIQDERKAASSMLQRVLGLVNLQSDREVWMLYTSYIRPNGAGLIASYGSEAQAIGLGSTGGGAEEGLLEFPALNWDEFSRDLRLAWYWCNDLYIFSLEGCARQGFIERLKSFTWDYPVILPEGSMVRVDGWRRSLQSALWLFSHWIVLVFAALSGVVIWKILNRLIRRNK